ncbi:xanthine dehydrogenase family protein molybdopterin-binding subunit [Streptomyces umbrinus]
MTSVGTPLVRVDGLLKATGTAEYTADIPVDDLTHAVLLQATIACGRIIEIDVSAAEAAPGVVLVLTHVNAPKLPRMRAYAKGGNAQQTVPALQDDRVRFAGETIAMVVAESLQDAQHAATLIRVEYEVQEPAVGLLGDSYAPFKVLGQPPDYHRGNAEHGMETADVTLEQTYRTPVQNHNPMEPHAVIARWEDGDGLTVYETSQGGVHLTRMGLAEALGIPMRKAGSIRVVSKYLGGGFGGKAFIWPRNILPVVAAHLLGRPVKLELTRAQMYTLTGYRSETLQRVQLGASADGKINSIVHESTSTGSDMGEFPEPCAHLTPMLYACPNVKTTHRLVRQNVGVPTFTRAPGEGPGSFAVESALDELASELSLDPLDLRLRNYAETDPEHDRPWSSKGLRECYSEGAERFGWGARKPEPGSMRDGRWLVGYGMATAAYSSQTWPAFARVRIRSDGTVLVRCATADIGTGTYTVMTQVAADALGVSPRNVTFELGDTRHPFAFPPVSSSGARSVGPAVHGAALAARKKVAKLAVKDRDSPLFGANADGLQTTGDGRLALTDDPSRYDTYADVLRRRGIDHVEERKGYGIMPTLHASAPGFVPQPIGRLIRAATRPFAGRYSTYDFGAQFVEVRVDPDLGIVRVSRVVGVYDIGRVLNPRTARNQAVGGITWGIGMALMEKTSTHPRLGKYASPNLSGYLVPTNADVPDIDVHFLDQPDPLVNPLGVKGVGELTVVGMAAAIANAVHHATGRRVRNLPIGPSALLTEHRLSE